MAKLKYLKTEQNAKMLVIWLDNPPANTLSSALMRELKRVLKKAADDESVRFLVIANKGRFFSAGADVNELNELLDKDLKSRRSFIRKNEAVLEMIEKFPKPVIAAIDGYALGGGCELALACHLRFASRETKLGLPEINLGIFPGWGGTWRLPRLIGKMQADKMILTGEIISSFYRASELGLVDKVVDSDKLLEEIKNYCKDFIDKPREALECAHRAVVNDMNQKEVADLFAKLLDEKSVRDGITAFLEKKDSKKKS